MKTCETIYAEQSCGQWAYWTYVDGQKVRLSRNQADKMISQGARLIRA